MNESLNYLNKKISFKEALCCCEYYNIQGERSHILALFCDCEIVDSICDRVIKREKISDDKIILLLETIEDRCRFPWFTGAVKINPANIAPVFLVPLSIFFASNGPLCTFFSFSLLPIILICINRLFSRGKRSKMFLVFAIVSILFSFLVFVTIVVRLRQLLLWELLLFLALFSICVKKLFKLILSNPKNHIIKKPNLDGNSGLELPLITKGRIDLNEDILINNSRNLNNDINMCQSCNKLHKFDRSGFCVICNQCIPLRDHHCVWIDKCVGEGNHKLFLYCLGLCIVTSIYGLHLTFTSVCTPTVFGGWLLVPSDCSSLYADYIFSISFVTALYASFFTAFLTIIFLHQLILISQNLTMHEWNRSRHKRLTTCYLFLTRQHNPYNDGFFRNWRLFLTQNRTSSNQSRICV